MELQGSVKHNTKTTTKLWGKEPKLLLIILLLLKEKKNPNGKCKQNSWSTKNLKLGNAGYSLIDNISVLV